MTAINNNEPRAFYSHQNATVLGTGAWIDCIAFTEDSAIEIAISGTAVVLLETSNDITNPNLTVDVSKGGTSDSVHWRIPKEAMFVRTNIASGTDFVVNSSVGRGISSLVVRPTSAQAPVQLSSGAQ